MLKDSKAILCLVLLIFACNTKPENELTLLFGGDVMLDRGVRAKINTHGMEYLLRDVRKEFQKSDYGFVNLECPVTDLEAPLVKQFIFRGDPDVLPSLREAGITHCILANNHSYDQGRDGLISTAENLQRAGILPVGYGITQQLACEPTLVDKNGVQAAIFSSVLLPLESWMYLEDSPGMCQATPEQLAKAIRQFRKSNPDHWIFVTFHWGVEYQRHPTARQREQAKLLVEAGANAIIGHHPHVVQRHESFGDSPVFYSIGNLIFDNPNPATHEGVLLKFIIHDGKLESHQVPYKTENVVPVLTP